MLAVLVSLMLVPALGALVVYFLRERGVRPAAVLFSLATLGLSLWAVARVYPEFSQFTTGGMPWIRGLRQTELFGVRLDPLSSLMLVMITAIGFLAALYSTGYLSARNKEHPYQDPAGGYYFWFLFSLASLVGLALSPNLLQLFIFWELITVCTWALVSHRQDDKSLRAGFKTMVLTHAGALFFLVGIFVVFITTRSFEFFALGALPANLKLLVFLFLLIAAWAKAAQFPFHTWLPDAHTEAPSPTSALLSGVMVTIGVYLMARVVLSTASVPAHLALVMAIAALFTMFMALMYYFVQDDLKRLLGYSTIAHLAYALLGVALGAAGSKLGLQGGVLHIVTHGFAKATLFLSVGVVAWSTGTRSIKQLSGLGRKLPMTGLAFLVGALAVTGVPPLSCFWSKFYILSGAVRDLPGALGLLLVVVLLLESSVSFAWMVYVGKRVFLGRATGDPPPAQKPVPWSMKIALIVLVAMCLLAPLVGIPLVRWIQP